MRRHYVSSSVIRWHGYDPGTRALEIEFTSGHLYRYSAVPPDIAAALQAADSKG